MRATTAFKRLLRLDGVNVTAVEFGLSLVVVTVALRRRRLVCPHCGHKTRWRYDTRPVQSRWRHLDLGTWRVEVAATLRRLRCPTHGVVVEAVPFARPGAHLSRDLDDLLAWLATKMDKTSVARLARVSWRSVGRACERVVAAELDPDRLDGMFRIGVDEISWRKHHKYLTLVVDHDRGCVIWGPRAKTPPPSTSSSTSSVPSDRPSSAPFPSTSALPTLRASGPRDMPPGGGVRRSVPSREAGGRRPRRGAP